MPVFDFIPGIQGISHSFSFILGKNLRKPQKELAMDSSDFIITGFGNE